MMSHTASMALRVPTAMMASSSALTMAAHSRVMVQHRIAQQSNHA
jgi:hypothetical protein